MSNTDKKDDELYHSATHKKNPNKFVNFNIQNATTKPYDIEYMTGKKESKGDDEK